MLRDRKGNELHIGDRVAWASKHADRSILKIGVVQSIEQLEKNSHNDWRKFRIKARIQLDGTGRTYTARRDAYVYTGTESKWATPWIVENLEILSIPY